MAERSLDEILVEGRLEPPRALQILGAVAQVVADAHDGGRTHGALGTEHVRVDGRLVTVTHGPFATYRTVAGTHDDLRALGKLGFLLVAGGTLGLGRASLLEVSSRVRALGAESRVPRGFDLWVARCIDARAGFADARAAYDGLVRLGELRGIAGDGGVPLGGFGRAGVVRGSTAIPLFTLVAGVLALVSLGAVARSELIARTTSVLRRGTVPMTDLRPVQKPPEAVARFAAYDLDFGACPGRYADDLEASVGARAHRCTRVALLRRFGERRLSKHEVTRLKIACASLADVGCALLADALLSDAPEKSPPPLLRRVNEP